MYEDIWGLSLEILQEVAGPRKESDGKVRVAYVEEHYEAPCTSEARKGVVESEGAVLGAIAW